MYIKFADMFYLKKGHGYMLLKKITKNKWVFCAEINMRTRLMNDETENIAAHSTTKSNTD